MAANSSLTRAIELHQQGRLADAIPLYQEVLAREPNNSDALHMAGLCLAALGQIPMAVKLLAAAAALQPTNPIILTNFASGLSQSGRQAEAVKYYDVALALRPDLLEATRGRGAALLQLGQLDAAVEGLRKAVALAPNDEQAQNTLGVALERAGRTEEAREAFRRALTLNTNNAHAHHNLGLVEMTLGRHAEALASIERAIALQPNDPGMHHNRGLSLFQLHRYGDALASFDRALEKMPTSVGTLLLRGQCLMHLARPAEALESFDRALGQAPNDFDANFQRARALTVLERLPEAVDSFGKAIAVNPNSAEAVNNRGAVLVRMFQPAEALPDFERAISLSPGYADAYINSGNALKGLARFPEALDKLDRALSIRPDDLTATWSKAILKLTVGDFRAGWPLYESRLLLEPARSSQRPFDQPRWTGAEPISGKTLLVHAEQGLGDTVQFARYIAAVEAMGAKVVFEVQPVLKRLLGSLRMRGTLIGRGEPLPEFDYHIPLLSLPLAMQTDLATIPGNVPYLSVDPDAVASWSQRLAALPGFKVGIHWHGNPTAEKLSALQARSFPLALLAPLARLEGVSLVSLQKGPGAEQREQVEFSSAIAQLTDPAYMGADELATETAAILKGLDLVITGDTALAHLAGALAVPVWLAAQFVPDWRWLMDRSDNPWYPTLRVFRQRTPGDWQELFERMATELATHREQRR